MRPIFFLSLLSILFLTTACEDDEPQVELSGDVNLVVRANYDGTLFQTQKEYEYIPGMQMKFTEFNFYVANISLLENVDATEETELTDIDFVDLSFDVNQTTEAEAGVKISTKKIPAGSYTAIRIGFGVPPDLNRTAPGDYGEGDVMNTSTHFWAPLASYIFSKIEGFSDNDGNGIFEASEGEGIRFHLGQDEVYNERILFVTNPIVIEDGQTVDLNLNLDIKRLFDMPINDFDANSDGLLDIEIYDESHGNTEAQEFNIDIQMMRNFSDAISLEQ